MLATERVIEIATDIFNSDCQKSIEQTLSTVSTAVAAIQQRSSEVQKLHANQQDDKETVKGQDREERYFEKKGRKEQGRSERQNCLVAELNLPIPHLSVQPEKSYVKSVEKRALPEVLQIQAQTNSCSLAANSLCAFYIPVLLCLNYIR